MSFVDFASIFLTAAFKGLGTGGFHLGLVFAMGLLLRTKDAAARLNVTPATLRRWRFEGTGPVYIRRGESRFSRAVYREENIAEWESAIATRRFKSTSDESATSRKAG